MAEIDTFVLAKQFRQLRDQTEDTTTWIAMVNAVAVGICEDHAAGFMADQFRKACGYYDLWRA